MVLTLNAIAAIALEMSSAVRMFLALTYCGKDTLTNIILEEDTKESLELLVSQEKQRLELFKPFTQTA